MDYQDVKDIRDFENDGQLIDEIDRSINTHIEDLNDMSIEDRRELYLTDQAFEITDSVWDSVIGTGIIRSCRPSPRELAQAVTVLDYAEKHAWVAEDRGLWEGLNPKQSLLSQAFFSLENVVRGRLSDNVEGLKE